jgi:hypothetical protein
MAHELITPAACRADHWDADGHPVSCLTCDGGLGICRLCGAAEHELEVWPTCEAFRNRPVGEP